MGQRKRRTRSVGLVLWLAASAAAGGEDVPLPFRVRDSLQKFVDGGEISGAVGLVGDAERVVDVRVQGRRDVERDLPMRLDTIFRVASMTKPIAAIGVMMLAEEGKLAIDDPVEKHIPEFRGQKMVVSKPGEPLALGDPPRPITLRDLLTHTSGLPDAVPPGGIDLDRLKEPTLLEAAKTLATRPLSFPPGTKWAYSNAGITTLGRVIEVASGQPFETFLRDRLFEPLGMADTTFYPTPEQMGRLAVTYDRKDGKLITVPARAAPTKATHYPSPAGGLYSKPTDLAQLYRMMLNRGTLKGRRYLSEASVAEMTRLQTGDIKTGFTEGMGYGLGWGVVVRPLGVTEALSPGTYGHGGAWGTQGWIDPKRGTYVILMIQRVGLGNSDASDVRRAFQRAVFPLEEKSGQ